MKNAVSQSYLSNLVIKIPRLHSCAKRLQCILDFMNKIEGRSNIEFY